MSGKAIAICTLAVVIAAAVAARADVFNMPSGQTSLQTVPVGDPGNLPDAGGSGAVSYSYSIGTYEVTNAQYCQFLNAELPDISDTSLNDQNFLPSDTYGLYSGGMSYSVSHPNNVGIAYDPTAPTGQKFSPISGRDNWPVVYVNWEQTIRFINWLQNGQGDVDTESGTYLITNGGQSTGNVAGFDTNTMRAYETPSAAGHWVLPTRDEWYKAAYYKGGGTNSGYWLYPTQSNGPPTFMTPTDVNNPANQAQYGVSPANAANYNGSGGAGYPRPSDHPIDVGSYPQSASPYGTLDQGGNASEWTETTASYAGAPGMLLLGGNCNLGVGELSSSGGNVHGGENPDTLDNFGFRVAFIPNIEVPEPGTILLAVAGGLCLLACAWRRHRKIHA